MSFEGLEEQKLGGELMDKKYDPVGEISIRGKAAKIVLDGESGDPVRFFCFLDDLYKLLRGEHEYVRIFRDNEDS